jgi:uncharacterized alkaline shock family protein YloU
MSSAPTAANHQFNSKGDDMADQIAEKPASGTVMERRSQGAGGLQTEKGATTIADAVVTKVAGIATREVGGVYELGGGVARAMGAVTQRLPGSGDSTSQGVSVEVGEKEAAVDLKVVVEYGESIPKVSQAIRENVIRRIEGITGLSVTEVNVAVNDLHMAGDDQDDDESSRVQ